MIEKYEEFEWKAPKDIWKGVGIYHITFVVSGRRKLLGEIRGVPVGSSATVERSVNINAFGTDCNNGAKNAIKTDRNISVKERAKMAWIDFTPFGKAVDDMLRHYDEVHDGIKVCKRKVLDDHVHVVLWVQKQ